MDKNLTSSIKNNDYLIDIDQLKIVGGLIKEARDKQSLTIESLAEKLCLDKQRLISLENGEAGNLPENVFVIGMIRQIARVLKIDADKLINQISINPPEIIEPVSSCEKISFAQRLKNVFKV